MYAHIHMYIYVNEHNIYKYILWVDDKYMKSVYRWNNWSYEYYCNISMNYVIHTKWGFSSISKKFKNL